ncbi:tetratricopeptide repeat protein [Streptomyces sp. GSL17-111]|uniref:tetratricopeptide repeat protein n=1 Tax=Streptomyces sp. GSL17-111 TaxID=3121596 RepID=UPI0030F3C4C7
MTPDAPNALAREHERAQTLVEVGRLDEAAVLLGRLVAESPDSASLWFELSRCRLEQRDLAAGLSAAQEAVTADPQYAAGYYVLSKALCELRQYPAAVVAAREGVRLAPEAAMSHIMLARALRRFSDGLDDALVAARHAVEAEPDSYLAHFELGMVFAARRDGPEALRAMREAVRIDPHNPGARANLAVLERGERQKNVIEFTGEQMRTLAEDPQNVVLLHNINANLHRLLRRARWISLVCLLLAVLAARVFVTGDDATALPAPLGTRLYALAVVASLVSVCWWLTFRRLPSGAWHSVRRLCRRSRLVRSAPLAAAWCLLGAALLLVVPWTDRTVLQLITHLAWVPTVVAAYVDHSVRKLKDPFTLYATVR